MPQRFLIILLLVSSVFLSSCGKETEDYPAAKTTDYLPPKVGRVLTYRLDSTVLLPFGTGMTVRSYQAKDSIESSFTDNQGRASYRVFRYIKSLAGTDAFRYAATMYITPTGTAVEVNESNLRFIKLADDINFQKTWKGNAFIDTKSVTSTVRYLDEWNYSYQAINEPYTVLKGTLDSTITVLQQDELTPPGPFDPNFYQQKNYSTEVYAKGIGLVYKEFIHWTWQTTPNRAYEDGSYGIKLNLIDYKDY